MKIKLSELSLAYPALVKLAQVNLPIKVSFSLLRYSKHIESEFKIFSELREKVFKKYGQQEGNNIVIKAGQENLVEGVQRPKEGLAPWMN